MADLEKLEDEYHKTGDCGSKQGTRRKAKGKSSGIASAQQISAALEERQPAPKHLEAEKSLLNKSKRRVTKLSKVAESARDLKLLQASRTLFQPKESEDEKNDSQEESGVETQSGSVQATEEITASENDLLSSMNNCSCQVCKELKKHSSESTRMFLILNRVFALNSSHAIRYLELASISPEEHVVELTKRKGVMIAVSDKNQIKIDCSGQPTKLIKETLFVLYGKEPFKQGQVIARGNRPGTFGLKPNVLSALLGFVNRNIGEKKPLTLTDLVTTINKRAVDWRKEADKSTIHQSKKEISAQLSKSQTASEPSTSIAHRSDSEEDTNDKQEESGMPEERNDNWDDLMSIFPPMPSTVTPRKVAAVERISTFSSPFKENRFAPYMQSPQRSLQSMRPSIDQNFGKSSTVTVTNVSQSDFQSYPPPQPFSHHPLQSSYAPSAYPYPSAHNFNYPPNQPISV